MRQRTEKVWGHTTHLYGDEAMEVHKIEVEPGGYCSIHRHDSRDNVFVVMEGSMKINTFDERGLLIDTVELNANHKPYTAPGGEWHQFECPDGPCVCYEIYYPSHGRRTIESEDIERRTVGGRINVEQTNE